MSGQGLWSKIKFAHLVAVPKEMGRSSGEKWTDKNKKYDIIFQKSHKISDYLVFKILFDILQKPFKFPNRFILFQ